MNDERLPLNATGITITESTNELPPPSEPEAIPCFVSTEDLMELWERILSW